MKWSISMYITYICKYINVPWADDGPSNQIIMSIGMLYRRHVCHLALQHTWHGCITTRDTSAFLNYGTHVNQSLDQRPMHSVSALEGRCWFSVSVSVSLYLFLILFLILFLSLSLFLSIYHWKNSFLFKNSFWEVAYLAVLVVGERMVGGQRQARPVTEGVRGVDKGLCSTAHLERPLLLVRHLFIIWYIYFFYQN